MIQKCKDGWLNVNVRCLVLNQAVEEIVATPEKMHTDKRKRCSERARAIMADQLDTSKTWSFQEFNKFNLRFYEQIESHFGHKEAWSRTHRIADRSANI